jgi:hypothetical protein
MYVFNDTQKKDLTLCGVILALSTSSHKNGFVSAVNNINRPMDVNEGGGKFARK